MGLLAFIGIVLLLSESTAASDATARPGGDPARSGPYEHRRGQSVRLPVEGRITGVIGDARTRPRPHVHEGFDIAVAAGSVVRAFGSGVVARVVDRRSSDRPESQAAGLYVDVHTDDGNTQRYLHLGQTQVRPGQRVERATTVIGTVEADHLHFELRKGRGTYGAALDPFAEAWA
jgi:murein DD-endopeptidase MepM/ murein hydrolase activator NlpD